MLGTRQYKENAASADVSCASGQVVLASLALVLKARRALVLAALAPVERAVNQKLEQGHEAPGQENTSGKNRTEAQGRGEKTLGRSKSRTLEHSWSSGRLGPRGDPGALKLCDFPLKGRKGAAIATEMTKGGRRDPEPSWGQGGRVEARPAPSRGPPAPWAEWCVHWPDGLRAPPPLAGRLEEHAATVAGGQSEGSGQAGQRTGGGRPGQRAGAWRVRDCGRQLGAGCCAEATADRGPPRPHPPALAAARRVPEPTAPAPHARRPQTAGTSARTCGLVTRTCGDWCTVGDSGWAVRCRSSAERCPTDG